MESPKMLTCGKRFTAVMLLLTALLAAGIVLNTNIGSVHVPAKEVVSMIAGAAGTGIRNFLSHGAFRQELDAILNATTQSQIIFGIRLPRLLLAAILGGALSVSGFLLQSFFRNPIAGPFVLGISSGSKMVVGITLIAFAGGRHVGSGTLVLAAFLGSLLITGVVLLFSQKVRGMSMLLVIGIMVGYLCSAVTDFCITFADDHDIVNLTGWSMGTFSGASWQNVQLALLLCIPGVLAAWLLAKPMSAYALGEAYAQSMGIRVRPFRAALILLSSLLSACVTALAGPISFVGIAVPHVTRRMLKSSRPALLIPASFLAGGVFCVFCDLLARTLFSPTELSIGTITSVFGAPVVIGMMVRRRRMQED